MELPEHFNLVAFGMEPLYIDTARPITQHARVITAIQFEHADFLEDACGEIALDLRNVAEGEGVIEQVHVYLTSLVCDQHITAASIGEWDL